MSKTTKFFVFFSLFTIGFLAIYLLLNLGLDIIVGLTYVPLPFYIIYGVGSLISIIATITTKSFHPKIIGIWAGITAIIVLIVGCCYNWENITKLFWEVLPIEAIIGFVFCFIITVMSGFFTGILTKKQE